MSTRVQAGAENAAYSIQYSGEDSGETSPLLDSQVGENNIHRFVWIIFLTILFGLGTGIGLYLLLEEQPKWYTTTPLYFIPRESWGALSPLHPLQPATHVFTTVRITETHSESCRDAFTCAEAVQRIQLYHMIHLNQSDLPYNFVIGGDGRTYEGKGWRVDLGNRTMVIGFLGNFSHIQPSKKQYKQAKVLIQEAIDQRVLDNCCSLSISKQDSAKELANVFYKLNDEIHKQRIILKCNSIR